MEKDKTIPPLSKTSVRQSVMENELRLGNLFIEQNSSEIISVIGLERNRVVFTGMFINEWQAKPIPLTEDWLLKLGFTQHHGDYYNQHLLLKNTGASKNEWDLKLYPNELGSASETTGQRFYFVHQIQNLYFSLTGRDLTVA